MLEFRVGGVRCRVSLLFPALVTALLLCQPDGLAVTCLLASVIHEGGHLLAMLMLRVPPADCVLGAFGLRIRLGQHLAGYGRNIWIALAGPLANGVAAAILLWAGVPQTAAVHLLLAALNLLPGAVLDGGEVLRCCLCLVGWERATDAVLRLSTTLALLPMAAVSLWLFLRRDGNPTLLIISVYLVITAFFSHKNEKTS